MAEGGTPEPSSHSPTSIYPQSFTIPQDELTFIRHLGSGGFGTVELHKHTNWGKVAVKQVIYKEVTPELKELIRNEVEKMYLANASKHVVTVMGMSDELCKDGGICIVMEYMEFGSLRHFTPLHLVSPSSDSGWKSCCWSMRIRMICEMILGMNYLHTLKPPIIHRDLKLENVFVGQGYMIKIGDLGLSVSLQSAALQVDRAGTITHIPPEVLTGKQRTAKRAWDLYSFGITLFEFLALTPDNDDDIPWPGFANTDLIENWVVKYDNRPVETEVLPDTPSFVTNTMRECWNADPHQRPSFQELKDRFTKIYEEKYEDTVDDDIAIMISRKPQRTPPPANGIYQLHAGSASPITHRSKKPVQATPTSTEAHQEGVDSSTAQENNRQSPSKMLSDQRSTQTASTIENHSAMPEGTNQQLVPLPNTSELDRVIAEVVKRKSSQMQQIEELVAEVVNRQSIPLQSISEIARVVAEEFNRQSVPPMHQIERIVAKVVNRPSLTMQGTTRVAAEEANQQPDPLEGISEIVADVINRQSVQMQKIEELVTEVVNRKTVPLQSISDIARVVAEEFNGQSVPPMQQIEGIVAKVVNRQSDSMHLTGTAEASTHRSVFPHMPGNAIATVEGSIGQVVSTKSSSRTIRKDTHTSNNTASSESREIAPLVSNDWQDLVRDKDVNNEVPPHSRVHTQPDSSVLGANASLPEGHIQDISASKEARKAIPQLRSQITDTISGGCASGDIRLRQRRAMLMRNEQVGSCDETARPEQEGEDDFDETGCGENASVVTKMSDTGMTTTQDGLNRPFQHLNLESSSTPSPTAAGESCHSAENGGLQSVHQPSSQGSPRLSSLHQSQESPRLSDIQESSSGDISFVDLSKTSAGATMRGPVPLSDHSVIHCPSPGPAPLGQVTKRVISSSSGTPQQEQSREPAESISQHLLMSSTRSTSSATIAGRTTTHQQQPRHNHRHPEQVTSSGNASSASIALQQPQRNHQQLNHHQQQISTSGNPSSATVAGRNTAPRQPVHSHQQRQQYHHQQPHPRQNTSRFTGSSKPTSGNDIPIKQRHVMNIEGFIGAKYRTLGRHLGFKEAEIDVIEHDHQSLGTNEVTHQILMKWIGKRGSKATKGVLVAALLNADLANAIKKL